MIRYHRFVWPSPLPFSALLILFADTLQHYIFDTSASPNVSITILERHYLHIPKCIPGHTGGCPRGSWSSCSFTPWCSMAFGGIWCVYVCTFVCVFICVFVYCVYMYLCLIYKDMKHACRSSMLLFTKSTSCQSRASLHVLSFSHCLNVLFYHVHCIVTQAFACPPLHTPEWTHSSSHKHLCVPPCSTSGWKKHSTGTTTLSTIWLAVLLGG
jgi:hypothetical protein